MDQKIVLISDRGIFSFQFENLIIQITKPFAEEYYEDKGQIEKENIKKRYPDNFLWSVEIKRGVNQNTPIFYGEKSECDTVYKTISKEIWNNIKNEIINITLISLNDSKQ